MRGLDDRGPDVAAPGAGLPAVDGRYSHVELAAIEIADRGESDADVGVRLRTPAWTVRTADGALGTLGATTTALADTPVKRGLIA